MRERLQRFRRGGRIGHRLRGENDQQAIGVRVFGGDRHRFRVKLRAGVTDDVHRIVVTPRRRQDFVERRHRGRGQFRELPAAGDERVRGQHAWTAGVGHDRQPRAFGSRLLGEHFRHVEQFRNAVHPQDAHALECGLQHFIAAGQRAGVGSRRLRRLRRAPRFDDDDGLGQRHFARGREKRPGVADRLHIDDDAFGVRIVAEMVDQIPPAHIEHRAEGGKHAEADVFLQAPVQNRRAERAALADEGHAAGSRHVRREGGVEFRAR